MNELETAERNQRQQRDLIQVVNEALIPALFQARRDVNEAITHARSAVSHEVHQREVQNERAVRALDAALAKGQEVVSAAKDLLHQVEGECRFNYSRKGSDTPYRDWFCAQDETWLLAMRLRLAMGMELPDDVKDLLPLVEEGEDGHE